MEYEPAKRRAGRLTAANVKAAIEPGVYGDGHGLALRVSRGTGRSWIFRYQKNGKAHEIGLGPARLITLAEARQRAYEAAHAVAHGHDPRRQHNDAEHTFRAVAEEYIRSHSAAWRSAVHASQWSTTLATYAYPIFGAKHVRDIALDDVLAVLRPIWTAKPETASRVRGRIEAILGYAKAQGWRDGPNPAAWHDNLAHLLPAKGKIACVQHHAAMPWRDMPPVMAELEKRNGIAAVALRFLILTAARSGEVRGATWPEIDFSTRTWTVPAERMKAHREHRVPLSEPAMAILADMALLRRTDDGVVFPGLHGAALSDVALSHVAPADVTVHGFRSTFRDWCSEHGKRADLAEAALAHVTGSKTVQAYLRGDLFEARRGLMESWAAFANANRRPKNS